MSIRFFLILFISVTLIGCTSSLKKQCAIKDLSGKCKSEIEIYKESIDSKENVKVLPLDVSSIPEVEDNLQLSSTLYKTWVADHYDMNKVLIGAHYIYWNLQEDLLTLNLSKPKQMRMLEPMLEPIK